MPRRLFPNAVSEIFISAILSADSTHCQTISSRDLTVSPLITKARLEQVGAKKHKLIRMC